MGATVASLNFVLKKLQHSIRRMVGPDVSSSSALAPAVAGPAGPLIDVKQLIESLSHEELLRSADEYFSRMTLRSEQCWKPFSNPEHAPHLTRHLGLVLEAADLFRGARVIEFGCGTGWLTIGLAQMGCDAIGVDISPAALALAREVRGEREFPRGGKAGFRLYDGKRLPFPDASVDRIVCYDAFHHVPDQALTLREFARVLRPGGRAAFIEPGPEHSKTAASQAEMANHKVIENDVSMVEVARFAAEAGLEAPRMLVQFQRPFVVDVAEFNAWAEKGIPMAQGALMWKTLGQQLTVGQCFWIAKGEPVLDSRRRHGLGAVIELRSAHVAQRRRARVVELEVEVRNTGSALWRTDGLAGRVTLGVQLLDAQGQRLNAGHGRIALPDGPVAPGQSRVVRGTVACPQRRDYTLRIDLVAELVAWFSHHGFASPVLLASSDIGESERSRRA